MLGDGVGSFARKSSKRIRRSNIDYDATSYVPSTISAGPGSGCLLSHCRRLRTNAEEISSGVDVHDAVKIFDITVGQRGMSAVVNLSGRYQVEPDTCE